MTPTELPYSHSPAPGITEILNATWQPGWNNNLLSFPSAKLTPAKKEWCTENHKKIGIAFHKAIELKLNGQSIDGCSQTVIKLINSVKKTGFLDKLGSKKIIEKTVIWQNKYPYTARLDCLTTVAGKPTLIDWSWRNEVITNWHELGDKKLQIAAQVKACRDSEWKNLSNAIIVIAHPYGEASIIDADEKLLTASWLELQERLKRYYN